METNSLTSAKSELEKAVGCKVFLGHLAVFPLYGHFDYLFCRIVYRKKTEKPS